MNKKYWYIITSETIRDEILIDMVNEFYSLVVSKLIKIEKEKSP